jgi:DNA polymerase-3 subunit alpha
MRTLAFDTETTGLLKSKMAKLEDQPSIIEFFGVVIDENGEEVEELEFLCYPGFEISEEIIRITGITPDMLKDEKPFSEYEEKLRVLIGSCDEVVAHNFPFDFGMIDNELKRCKTDESLTWPTKLCTIEKSMILKGHRLNLTKLHTELFGEGFPEAHRARNDVMALKRCFIEMRKREML